MKVNTVFPTERQITIFDHRDINMICVICFSLDSKDFYIQIGQAM